jgi:two-component system response regulator DesR
VNPERRLRVLVVDDHDLVLRGLRAVIAGEPWVQRFILARSAAEGLAMARRYEPHVALIDVSLGDGSGLDLCREIRETLPVTRVLLLSGLTRMSRRAAQTAGASGFVPKFWNATDVASSIRMVGLGMAMYAPLPQQQEEEQNGVSLTKRELEVLELLAEGWTNREIGERLYLSQHTVREHASAVYKKMTARNRAEAVLRAQRMGFIA